MWQKVSVRFFRSKVFDVRGRQAKVFSSTFWGAIFFCLPEKNSKQENSLVFFYGLLKWKGWYFDTEKKKNGNSPARKRWCSGDLEGKKGRGLNLTSIRPHPHPLLLSYINLSAGLRKQFTAAELLEKKFCLSRALGLGCFIYIRIFICMRRARWEANNKYAAKVKMRASSSQRPPPRPCWDTPTVCADVLSRCA